MAFEDYKQKESVAIVYTGNGKGKTSASLGLMCRALGRGWRVAYAQFIKEWEVGEHTFIKDISSIYKDRLILHKGGKGFFNAGEISAENVSSDEHKAAAKNTYDFALKCVSSGKYDLVICDEINNAIHDGLLEAKDAKQLLTARAKKTSICFTGRNFPKELYPLIDIATEMKKIKHHYDEKFLANKGIDY